MSAPRHHLRRSVLKGMAAFACPVCLGALGRHGTAIAAEPSSHGAGAAPHWSYEGEGDPAHWGELSPDFKVCQLGLGQSPIDLSGSIRAAAGEIDVAFGEMPLRIVNNGHTIQVNAAPGSGCAIDGSRYELLQFHFHHPSEHLLDGKAFGLECHFVHRAASGGLAVLGVLVATGAHNDALQPIWDAMPHEAGPERDAGRALDPAALLPKSRGYFRYMGSLTTPPCSEGILWTVYREPIEAAPEQMKQFAALFANNARPVQGRNRRFLLDVD